MKNKIRSLYKFLKVATSAELLEWQSLLLITSLSVIVHLLASVDIGFEQVLLRIILAGVSVLPMFLLMKILCVLTNPRFRVSITLLAIVLGGYMRGAIITTGLQFLNVQSLAANDFRLIAGVVISLTITLSSGYLWTTIQRSRKMLAELREENEHLRETLLILDNASRAQETTRAHELVDYVKSQVELISKSSAGTYAKQLEQLVTVVVRPMTTSWASRIEEFSPSRRQKPEVTLRGVWNSLDSINHLPSPLFSTSVILLTGYIAWSSTYGRTLALQLAWFVGLTLYVSLNLGYKVANKFLGGRRTWPRDISLTIFLIILTIPSILVSIWVLRNTLNPYASVLPGLITVPLLGWIYMVGNAALNFSDAVIEELEEIRNRLNWSITRVNLLAWHQQGVITRLLHGVVQNTIQVGLYRIQSAKSEAEQKEVLIEVISRINDSIREVSDETQFSRTESEALANIVTTWTGVASIQVLLSETSEAQLQLDPASFSITVDLIQELCSNAIRHGGATTINFEIDIKKDTLAIQGTDNGNSFSGTSHRSGLGTHFIESCTTRYDRQRIDGRNIYALEIPFIA